VVLNDVALRGPWPGRLACTTQPWLRQTKTANKFRGWRSAWPPGSFRQLEKYSHALKMLLARTFVYFCIHAIKEKLCEVVRRNTSFLVTKGNCSD